MHWPEFVNELSLGHNYLKRQWVLTVGGAAEIAALNGRNRRPQDHRAICGIQNFAASASGLAHT